MKLVGIVIGLIGMLIVILVGVFIWSRPGGQLGGTGFELEIESIFLGTPRSTDTTKLVTKKSYTSTENIALRAETSLQGEQTITLRARLRSPDGSIKNLSPATVILKAGTSTTCCWMVDEAGDYTIQLFRPDNKIISLPIKITQAAKGPADQAIKKPDFEF